MTTRADLRRLFAAAAVLGTEAEIPTADGTPKAERTWDVTHGWEFGPRKAPAAGERGGGGGEAGADERKDEAAQSRRASKRHTAYQQDLALLDEVTQRLFKHFDIACPPNPADVKNRRTGDLDPVTAADVALAGWCASCWRNDQQMVPREKDKHDLYYYRDHCRWCGEFNAKHGIEPPLPLLTARHAGRSISEADVTKALKEAKPKGKKGRRKKGKVAA